MSAFIRPCSPTSAKVPPKGDAWLHEPKLDGYRLQVVKDSRQVRLYSRNGDEWTKRLTPLAEALAGIRCRSAIIDAELCFPNFYGLQAATGSSRQHKLAVFAFDLLHHNGEDLRKFPLLEELGAVVEGLDRVQARQVRPGQQFHELQPALEAAERHGLEGIVSKRRAAPYHSGPSTDWRKVKAAAWREANRERWKMF